MMMKQDVKDGKGLKNVLMVLGLLLVIAAVAFVLWRTVFQKESLQQYNRPTSTDNSSPPSNSASKNAGVSSLISYTLPPGWTDTECIGSNNTVLVIPTGRQKPLDCTSGLKDWPLKIYIDPQNTTDCNQIKNNQQQITKHTCKSLFIDGHKTLEALTDYNASSPYGKPTRASAYYINTGKGVVKLEFTDNLTTAEDDFQAGFWELTKSVKVKSA